MQGWVRKSSLQVARSHTAVAVYGKTIYTFGGGGDNFESLDTFEIYDMENDQWRIGGNISTSRSGAVASVLGDKIYLIGGGFRKEDGRFHFYNMVELYDPISNLWTKGPPMLQPHDYPASVVLDGRIYIIGGHHPEATSGGPMTDPGFSFCEVFDPQEGGWQEITPMPTPRFASAAVAYRGKILVLGGAGLREDGFMNFDVIESYDPQTDRWSDEGIRLPWRAAGLCAFTYQDRLYVIGGNSGQRIENRFAHLDPESGRWIELSSLEEGRIVMGIALVEDTVYLIGGRGPDKRTPLSTVYTYHLEAER